MHGIDLSQQTENHQAASLHFPIIIDRVFHFFGSFKFVELVRLKPSPVLLEDQKK